MRTTVIPAQVTTVEDTIAGNLTLTQIILLILPVLFSTAIYAVLPEKLSFTLYKIPLMGIVSLIFVVLAQRIKGRLILNWIVLLTTYFVRPHLFVFNKNTLFARDFAPISVKRKAHTPAKTIAKNKENDEVAEFDYESLLRETDVQVRFTRKGLLVVKNI